MIDIVPMEYQEEWDWLVERADVVRTEETRGIVAYKGSKLVGAVAMDNWAHNSCRMHIAVDDMFIFKHGFPEAVYNYIFNTCDKGVIIGITPAHLDKVLRFNRHVGFVEVYRIPDGYEEGIDLVVQENRKENCRYLRETDGQINSSAS